MAMATAHDTPRSTPARWQDFLQLMKPRVMSLVVFTALTGLVCAPGQINPILGVVAILCIAVGAGASGALNMWYDADIDAKMRRTRGRPVPAGKVQGADALGLGVVLSLFSVMLMGVATNWLAAGLLAFTIVFYAVVYTMWLKRRTAQNIVIGGASGAMPPVLGWAAMTGEVGPEALILFLIIFLWTPPHFWALALYRVEDYRKAGLPMLPVTHGNEFTRLQVLLYTFILFAACLMPFIYGMSGWLYLAVAVAVSIGFTGYALALWRKYSDTLARKTFRFSLIHLSVLFAALLIDHYLR
jgi:protoheme IX farnesyltransferase